VAIGVAARPVVAVGAIAFDDAGRVLLVERRNPPGAARWTVPGGRVELGETLAEACAREVREETGLVVAVGPAVEVVELIGRDAAGAVTHHFVIVDYLVAVRGGALAAADDAGAARWVAEAELDGLALTDGLTAVLQRAREMRRGA
jgi:ADP-ribose pyrophosphatase YjhB (NUDIX family)